MYEEQSLTTKRKIKPVCFLFLKKWLRKNYVRGRQSRETKTNRKLVWVSREPVSYLEFKKPNKQNIYEIH